MPAHVQKQAQQSIPAAYGRAVGVAKAWADADIGFRLQAESFTRCLSVDDSPGLFMSGLQGLPFGFLALRAGTLSLRPVPETPESERQKARKGICLPKKDGMPAILSRSTWLRKRSIHILYTV